MDIRCFIPLAIKHMKCREMYWWYSLMWAHYLMSSSFTRLTLKSVDSFFINTKQRISTFFCFISKVFLWVTFLNTLRTFNIKWLPSFLVLWYSVWTLARTSQVKGHSIPRHVQWPCMLSHHHLLSLPSHLRTCFFCPPLEQKFGISDWSTLPSLEKDTFVLRDLACAVVAMTLVGIRARSICVRALRLCWRLFTFRVSFVTHDLHTFGHFEEVDRHLTETTTVPFAHTGMISLGIVGATSCSKV